MKAFTVSLLFMFYSAANICYAQNSILAGKIVDEDNNPVAGAIIKISSKAVSPVEARSDSDGIYCSKAVAVGHYHMAVFVNGQCRGLKKITLDESSGAKKFYLIRMSGGNIEVSPEAEDPAMAVKLNKMNSNHDEDGGVYRMGTYILRNDSTRYFRAKKDTATRK